MDKFTLQTKLAERGCYTGPIDGLYGSGTRSAVMDCLECGADNPVTDADLDHAAGLLGVGRAEVLTVRSVEAAGAGFQAGLPKILFEPHRFSKLTKRRFDASHPAISYPGWGDRPYPKSQAGRYEQLVTAVGLDVDAGFAAASYGSFQILGENAGVCGYPSSFAFAMAQAQSEGDQLEAFVRFCKSKGLDKALQRHDWATFARGYNGSAYAKNAYDVKLADAFRRFAGRL